jgi:hypothetical protein
MFTIYVAYALILVMRKSLSIYALDVRGFMSGYTYWIEHGEYKDVVGVDDDVD